MTIFARNVSESRAKEHFVASIDLSGSEMDRVDRRLGLHYGSIAFFSAIIHNVFLLYHVEAFVSIYKIDKMSFWVGETVFLIWNSCNDPLFGWISDKGLLSGSLGTTNIVLKRLRVLSWSGPLFALSFLLFWGSWTYPAVQFVIGLCVYDSFLTMVDLHHSALLADLALSADARTTLNFYCSLFSALGSLSVFLSYVVWNREVLVAFQVFCCSLACISAMGFLYSCHVLRKMYVKKLKSEDLLSGVRSSTWTSLPQKNKSTQEKAALRKFISELSGHQNFKWFAAMNLIQVFHCHFNSNFFPLFLESLLGDDVPQVVCSLILGVSFVAPHLNNLYFLSLVRRFGAYSVIRTLFLLKLLLSFVMYYMGLSHLWLLCLFIASNRVFTEGTCKLLSLVISDLVDEDFVLHGRTQAVSALVFGTAALLSKPGQTLAPLIGTWLLSMQTGHDVFESGNQAGSLKLSLSGLDAGAAAQYRQGVFQLLVYVPMVCGVLQLLAWSHFSLRGKRLHWVKNVRAGLPFATV